MNKTKLQKAVMTTFILVLIMAFFAWVFGYAMDLAFKRECKTATPTYYQQLGCESSR